MSVVKCHVTERDQFTALCDPVSDIDRAPLTITTSASGSHKERENKCGVYVSNIEKATLYIIKITQKMKEVKIFTCENDLLRHTLFTHERTGANIVAAIHSHSHSNTFTFTDSVM